MNKTYDPQKYEKDIYTKWENAQAFAEKPPGKPYTILMPPPNANASLHAGHAMYTVDDILVRWKRMQGFSALWIPGMDHAGFETQYVYEKNLSKQGKSRMDFDRDTLYKNIFTFVQENSGLIFDQMKRLGFSAAWDRSVFTLHENVVQTVYQTFTQMEKEGLVYRDTYLVNFCAHDGTSLAELEVKHVERKDPLYYIKYKLKTEKGYVVVATTRPEPIFIDTHLAVNPKDSKTNHLIGKLVLNPLTGKDMTIIGDGFVDPNFGTGIVKLTPAHDATDYLVAKKHHLPIISCIDTFGRIKQNDGKYAGLKVGIARQEVVKDLTAQNLIEKIDTNYTHTVLTCYKCGHDLEPMITPNWFIKVKDLKKKVQEVVAKESVKFYPARFKTHMLTWLKIMHDWPISRQVVWGIRIPVWYDADQSPDLEVSFIDKAGTKRFGPLRDFYFKEVEAGLQSVHAPENSRYIVSDKKPNSGRFLPETDTFDTWFSSSQWPLVTLKNSEFKTRFPTDTMGTLSDILEFWVSRMILFSLYLKNDIPFKHVYLWSMVADSKGVKMSKSKGNVINPIDLVDKYGADALRLSLMYGTSAGSKVILSEDKVRAMRNFTNKIWNIGRYLEEVLQDTPASSPHPTGLSPEDEDLLSRLNSLIKEVTTFLEKYQFNFAIEKIYHFSWHILADNYLEKNKTRLKNKNPQALYTLKHVYLTTLKLLHPFAPFVTEALWQELNLDSTSLLITSPWPTA